MILKLIALIDGDSRRRVQQNAFGKISEIPQIRRQLVEMSRAEFFGEVVMLQDGLGVLALDDDDSVSCTQTYVRLHLRDKSEVRGVQR